MKNLKEQKGITLIALVVTIIVLLILAGVTIGAITGENGILKNAQKAAEENAIAKGKEQIQLVLADDTIKRTITGEELTAERLQGIFEEKEWVTGVEIEKISETEEKLTITNDEGYIYDIIINNGKIEVEYIGKSTGPIISEIEVVNKNTNSIEIKVKTRNAKGEIKYTYSYKQQGEEEYTIAESNSSSDTYIYEGLEANKIYNIKVEIQNSEGKAEKVKEVLTGEMPEGTITFEEMTWENGEGRVKVKTSEEGYTLQYQIGSIEGEWKEIENEGIIEGIKNGETVYARLWDGANGTEEASVDIKDEEEPVISSVIANKITDTTIEITVTASDAKSGLATTETYKYYLGEELKETSTNNTYTYTNLADETEHRLVITVIDAVGNTVTKEVKETTEKSKTDGDWNEAKAVNMPDLNNTGLTPIYFDTNNNPVELTEESTETEWDNWYDYESNKWANAVTKDSSGNITGYFVWIPRYAYKITSNLGTNTAGTIEVKFLKGTTNYDENNTQISTTYPEVENNAMADYVVHPSFTNGTKNNFQNGEWNTDIPGIWVAKYEAGYQANTTNTSGTVINGTDEVIYSNYKYTSVNPSITNNATNALSQDLSETGYSTEYISYPVFKPLTYSYNMIGIGDCYTISRDIQNKTSFYGLTNIDSHMMKNSEWGAVAYLAQSKYGTNGTEITVNSKNLNNLDSKQIYGVTGYAEDRALGVDASTTKNITGVFDLSGGSVERVVSYITNKNDNLKTFGESFAYYTTAETNPETRSTKYATAYPYNSTSDTGPDNYDNLKTNFWGKRYGDAILEVSPVGGSQVNSWYGKFSQFSQSNGAFLQRGYGAVSSTYAGSFAFAASDGSPGYNCAFRTVLIAN